MSSSVTYADDGHPIFDFDVVPMFDAFPAFYFLPDTVMNLVGQKIMVQLDHGCDPQWLSDFVNSKAGMLTLAAEIHTDINACRRAAA